MTYKPPKRTNQVCPFCGDTRAVVKLTKEVLRFPDDNQNEWHEIHYHCRACDRPYEVTSGHFSDDFGLHGADGSRQDDLSDDIGLLIRNVKLANDKDRSFTPDVRG